MLVGCLIFFTLSVSAIPVLTEAYICTQRSTGLNPGADFITVFSDMRLRSWKDIPITNNSIKENRNIMFPEFLDGLIGDFHSADICGALWPQHRLMGRHNLLYSNRIWIRRSGNAITNDAVKSKLDVLPSAGRCNWRRTENRHLIKGKITWDKEWCVTKLYSWSMTAVCDYRNKSNSWHSLDQARHRIVNGLRDFDVANGQKGALHSSKGFQRDLAAFGRIAVGHDQGSYADDDREQRKSASGREYPDSYSFAAAAIAFVGMASLVIGFYRRCDGVGLILIFVGVVFAVLGAGCLAGFQIVNAALLVRDSSYEWN